MRRVVAFSSIYFLVGAAYAQGLGALSAAEDQIVLRVSATGIQVYECRAAADGALSWRFKEPRADLFVGTQRIGRHYAGPTWEHVDGSRIVGRVVVNQPAPQPNDIPWIRLAVVSHDGEGALSSISAVQRVATHGGVMIGTCDAAGSLAEMPYTAEYLMLRTGP
ncbi:DUF3455 domain-containing protein [Methylobacterium crusticola]|uniref:DUF3455 domain-containing protein n=1 Tax=Methylobacterium crusticola TaxID=1697972 RepID=UPI0013969242|nr:DUF3455 domain-containing protein [Methylobacterium crusticola]